MRSKKEKSGKQINRNRRAIELLDSYLNIGWTKTAIAEHCNIALSTIRRWEEGSSPNLSTMRRLESIETAIERQKKVSKYHTDVEAWHEAGGHEWIETLKDVQEKIRKMEQMGMESVELVESFEWKESLRINTHIWNGKMLRLVKSDFR